MDLKCILTFSCLTLAKNPFAQDLGVLSPDRIYFNDGDQRIPSNGVLPLDGKRNWQNQETNWQNNEASFLQGNRNVNSVQAQPVLPNRDTGFLGNQGNLNVRPIPSAPNPNRDTNLQGNRLNGNPLQTQSVVSSNRDPNYVQGNRGNLNPLQAQSVVSPNRDPVFLQGNQENPNFGQQQSIVSQDRFGNNPLQQNPNLNNNLNPMKGMAVSQAAAYYEQSAANNDFRPAVRNATAPVDPVSLALSDFSLRFMKSVPGQRDNLVVSPFSVATLLSLLQQGSLGGTQHQITSALQLTPTQAADGFRKLTNSLNKRLSSNILRVANSLFIADGFELNPAYKRIAINDFGSEVNPIKFNRPAIAAQKINNWVASKTNSKIDNLITPEAVSSNTQLVLVNAVYFKGLWEVKFKPEATMLRDFFLSNGGKKNTHFMRMRRNFRTDFDKTTNSQILVLPFENELYSLVLILPSVTSTVTSVLASLTKEHLLAYQNLAVKEVAIELPKFTVKTDTDLITVLNNLGITKMFGPQAELTGIGNYREFSPQVSSALHSALLSIDEEGGVAAAASSFAAVALSYDDPTVVFNANRPFLAVLWDNTVSIPLFMARIEDPVS